MKFRFATSGVSARVNRQAGPQVERPPLGDRRLAERLRNDDAPWEAKVRITDHLPELGKFIVQGDNGLRLTISKRTHGVSFQELAVGQHLCVRLQGRLAPKVLSAELA
jgi:hypothetical protein